MDLIQHNLGGIIGRFQERTLAATSKKGFTKRIISIAAIKEELFVKNLREGATKRGQ